MDDGTREERALVDLLRKFGKTDYADTDRAFLIHAVRVSRELRGDPHVFPDHLRTDPSLGLTDYRKSGQSVKTYDGVARIMQDVFLTDLEEGRHAEARASANSKAYAIEHFPTEL